MDISGLGKIEATLIDVSNPLVMVRAEDIGLKGTELPDEVNANKAACMMGFAKDLKDATDNSPVVPKVGFFSAAASYGYCFNNAPCAFRANSSDNEC